MKGRTALRWRLAAVAALALALTGVAVAAYLVFENARGEAGVCVGVGGCEAVQESRYGELFGVPVSVPGLLLYLVLFGAAAAWFFGAGQRLAGLAFAGFLAAFAGLLVSAYLTYVEAFVLDDWCSYCIVSALLMAGLFAAWSALLAGGLRSNPA
jgi:uncharacterized membrane protein